MGKMTNNPEQRFANIINALKMGEENAIHQKELAEKLNISPQTLKATIKTARKCGLKILSSQKGYYLSNNPREIERFIKSMAEQAKSRFGSISKLRKAIKDGSVNDGK